MKLRMSMAMAGVLALSAGGCASGGATSAPTERPPSISGGEVLAQGEPERNNDMTRSSARALEDAALAETPQAATALYQQAADAANEAIAADITNPLPYFQAGLAYIGLQDYGRAASMLDRAEELRPVYTLQTERTREQVWISIYQQAAPMVNDGDYPGAIALLEQADLIYDGRVEVKLTLGRLYVALSRWDEGISILESAMTIINSPRIDEMDPETAADWRDQASGVPVDIAQAQIGAGYLEEAAASLEALIVTEPNNTSYLNTLASVYVRMEQPERANEVYDRLMAIPGLEGTDLYNIGVGLYQSSDYAAAGAAFAQAAEASVNDRDALEMWARSYQIAYSPTEDAETPTAILESLAEAAGRWAELDPNNTNAYLVQAQTANRLDDEEGARAGIAAAEGLEFTIDNLQIQRSQSGGGLIVGGLTNKTLAPGTTITLNFTAYDAEGMAIGSEAVRIQAPAVGAASAIRVEISTDDKIHGYGYTVGM